MTAPDLNSPPVIIRQSRKQSALLFAVSATFVAGGAWIYGHPDGRWVGGLNMVFFGLCTLVALAVFLFPGTLSIGPDGLVQTNLGRRARWDWNEVSGFRVWRAHRTSLVTFDSTRRKDGLLRRTNMALGAGSDSLAPQWAMRPQELADLLEAARARWGEARGAPPV